MLTHVYVNTNDEAVKVFSTKRRAISSRRGMTIVARCVAMDNLYDVARGRRVHNCDWLMLPPFPEVSVPTSDMVGVIRAGDIVHWTSPELTVRRDVVHNLDAVYFRLGDPGGGYFRTRITQVERRTYVVGDRVRILANAIFAPEGVEVVVEMVAERTIIAGGWRVGAGNIELITPAPDSFIPHWPQDEEGV